ncbi:MAG: hypothetical protein IPP78_15375 [Holophagaceae bacterium]|nr:hypothetical protein [Holophagaceae bacterium]
MRKHLSVAILVLACGFASLKSEAQSCNPDISYQDKIAKTQTNVWTHNINEMGFWKSMADDLKIYAGIGGNGEDNGISIQVDNSMVQLAGPLENTIYRIRVGDTFAFGFKNGKPLSFVATSARNQSTSGGISVKLSAYIPNSELANLRSTLTTKPIDAVRISLSGGPIERSVSDENGKKMMERFSCFYQYMDKRGINLSPGAGAQSQPGKPSKAVSIQGKYLRKSAPNDFLDLGRGIYSGQQGSTSIEGTYEVQGDTLILAIPKMHAKAKARIVGNTLIDSEGNIWEKQAQVRKPADQLSIDQIIQMITAKIPDDLIIKTIQSSGSTFDLPLDALIKLKKANASDAVTHAMMQNGSKTAELHPAQDSERATDERNSDAPNHSQAQAVVDKPSPSPERVVPFRTGEPIPLDIVQGGVTITSIEVTGWPKLEALQKAVARPDEMTNLTVKITNENQYKKTWKGRYRVEILDDKGAEIGLREWEVSLGGGEKADTNRASVKMKALDFPRAARLRVRVLWRSN